MKITDTYLVHPNEVDVFESNCATQGIEFKRVDDVFPFFKYEVTGERISNFIALGVNMTLDKLKDKL